MSQFLITGGAGFIGSALARSLLRKGHKIVIVDNLTTGQEKNIPRDAEFILADLANPASISLLPDFNFDAIVHLAAQSSGVIGQLEPYADFQTNVGSTMLLSRWCIERRIKRFIYTSSMTVYGTANVVPMDEEAIYQPISYYGASKLASENYLKIAAIEGINATALRFYNVYGPGQNLGNIYQGMVSIYLAYLLNNAEVPVTGALDRFRDFLYIDDAVSALETILEMPKTPSPNYNIGTGKKYTVADVLSLLITEMGLPDNHPIKEVAGSPSDLFGSVADITRARDELSWKPAVDLKSGLSKMVSWAKEQEKPGISHA